MGIVLFILWNSVTLQSNQYAQVTPTGSYTTPIILTDTTGSGGSLGMQAYLSIALNSTTVGIPMVQ